MQINANIGKSNGPSSKMQTNQAALLTQINTATSNAYKTPSMAFLENKRREEEKQLQQQQSHHQQPSYPQSADFKKVQVPLSPLNANSAGTGPMSQVNGTQGP